MWFIGVEVEQETSAPPPKKNPGSAPDIGQNYFYFRYDVMFDRIACILVRIWARDTL